jgi:hypothetical protein
MADTIETATTMTTMRASKKIKLNPSTPFTGKRSDFVLFMQDVYVYLKVNRQTYDNDDKKISFILSYLTGGDAAVWKQQFIQMKIEEHEEANTTGEHTRNSSKPSRRHFNHTTSQQKLLKI